MNSKYIIILFFILILGGCNIKPSNSTPTESTDNPQKNIDAVSTDTATTDPIASNTDPITSNTDTIDTPSKETSPSDTLPTENPVESKDYMVVEEPIETYHDNIQDLHGLNLPIDLTDERLDEVKLYLAAYDFNFTLNQIGEISAPDSIYVLGNKLNRLPSDFEPSSLRPVVIPFTFEGVSEKKELCDVAATTLEALIGDAANQDISLFGLSGYRSYNTQISNYTSRVNSKGQAAADKISARPGHSEHQTGLTMDVTSESAGFALIEGFGETKEGLWLRDNAHLYGFILRYPQDKTAITGYNYEPWHIRYVGEDLASYIFENRLTLEELYAMLLQK